MNSDYQVGQASRSSLYDYDLFVIGGGSAGVRCARVAAEHGARVGIAEQLHWGGTCVNVGCVPKKLMVMAAEYGRAASAARGFGWDIECREHDWRAFIAAKDREIERLNSVYRGALDRAGAVVHDARVRFLNPHTLELSTADGSHRRLTAGCIVVATGGHPVRPQIPGAELGIISDQAFHLPEMPGSVCLIGAGYVAVEFAGIFRGLGAEVELVCRSRLPLRGFDEDLRQAAAESLELGGVRLHCEVSAEKIERTESGLQVQLTDGRAIETALVFWAAGRVPTTCDLGLDAAGIATDARGAVIVDQGFRSSQAHVYAIGDVSNRQNLTPVAIAEGHMLADRLYGRDERHTWALGPAVPTAVFGHPPLAAVGLTEEQAAAHGPCDIYQTSFTPLRHVLTGRPEKTFLKLIVHQANRRVLGFHMLGDDAAEIAQGFAVAMHAGATKQHFDQTVGIHPTVAEEWVTLRKRTRSTG